MAEFENFISDKKKRFDKKTTLIEAYESILLDDRRKEKDMLNIVRDKEY